jgi:hypothetical protein
MNFQPAFSNFCVSTPGLSPIGMETRSFLSTNSKNYHHDHHFLFFFLLRKFTLMYFHVHDPNKHCKTSIVFSCSLLHFF